MEKEIKYKKQGDGADSWSIIHYNMIPVNKVLKTEKIVDENGNESFTDIFEIDQHGNIVFEMRREVVSAEMVFEDPEKKPIPSVDVIGLLKSMSFEEREELKQLLR